MGMPPLFTKARHPERTIVLLLMFTLCYCGKSRQGSESDKPVGWKLKPPPGCFIQLNALTGADGIPRRETKVFVGVQNDSETDLCIDSIIVFDSVRANPLPSNFVGLNAAMTYPPDSFSVERRTVPPKSWRMGGARCFWPESRMHLRTLGVEVFTNRGKATAMMDSLYYCQSNARVVPD